MRKELNSLKAYIKKEYMEGIRTHKFLILALGVLFFSVADPAMVKLMPVILKSQFGNMDFSLMVDLSQRGAMANYAKDLFQISTFVTVLTLMGIISGERNDKTFIIPISMGCSINGILYSKIIVYGTYLTALSVTGMTIAYYYSGIILGQGYASYAAVFKAGLLYGLFFVFVISLLALISSMAKKPFIAGILTLLTVYLIPALQSFKWLGRYLPTHLLTEARYFSTLPSVDLTAALVCTIAIAAIMSLLSVVKLENTEFV